MPLFPGYDIECLIATGGMGAVYRAVQRSLDRTVALKILPREFSADAAFCAGFEAEAKAMARLNHPNLIGVYDFGEVQGMLYIIMEYVPGQSLFHSANGQAIDPGEVVRLVTGICSGLAHAHQHGILHRDIKPANVLLDPHVQPKIGDFGLARPVDRQVEEGEEIFGTPHYTAPEVVDAPQSVDNRADIFSVGVVLHELLTGKLPADDPRPASAIAGCHPRFDAVIRRATHPSPAGRYASAAEMANELQQIATAPAPRILRTAAPAGRALPVRPVRSVQVKEPSSFPMILTVLLLAGIAYGIYAFGTREKPTPAQSPSPVSVPETEIGSGVIELPPVRPEPSPPEPVVVEGSDPTPELEPMPEPVVEPEVDMTSDQESEPPPAPPGVVPAAADADVVGEESEFDVPAFFTRARGIMSERAAGPITAREEALVKNTAAAERELNREIRGLTVRGRDGAEEALRNRFAEWKEDGHRLPSTLDEAIGLSPEINRAHAAALARQTGIDNALAAQLQTLSGTYILGLERQKERVLADGDEVAAKLIQREIDITREDPGHFPDLMTSDPPQDD